MTCIELDEVETTRTSGPLFPGIDIPWFCMYKVYYTSLMLPGSVFSMHLSSVLASAAFELPLIELVKEWSEKGLVSLGESK